MTVLTFSLWALKSKPSEYGFFFYERDFLSSVFTFQSKITQNAYYHAFFHTNKFKYFIFETVLNNISKVSKL